MNKKGGANYLALIAVVLIGIVALGATGYFLIDKMQKGTTPKGEIIGTGAEAATGATAGTGAGGVNIYSSAATLSSTGASKLQEGTTVGVVGNYRTTFSASTGKNVPSPKFSTSTSASVGDVVDVFITNGSTGAYYSEYLPQQKITGLTPKFEATMCKNATLTITMFDADDGLSLANGLVAAGGNQTFESGATKTMKFVITGTQFGCQPDGIRVYLETNSSDTIDSMMLDYPGMTLDANGIGKIVETSLPSSLSQMGGNQKVAAFDIPSVNGAKKVEGTVTITAKSAKDPSTMSWRVRAVPKVKFKDTNSGEIVTGIEDSDGTLKALQVEEFGTSIFD